MNITQGPTYLQIAVYGFANLARYSVIIVKVLGNLKDIHKTLHCFLEVFRTLFLSFLFLLFLLYNAPARNCKGIFSFLVMVTHLHHLALAHLLGSVCTSFFETTPYYHLILGMDPELIYQLLHLRVNGSGVHNPPKAFRLGLSTHAVFLQRVYQGAKLS